MATPVAGGYYPPVGFHFKVEFVNLGNDNDQRFQSVTGLNVPVRTKYPDLSLKRGMLTNSKVIDWCIDALQNRSFKPVQVNVTLLNEEHNPITTWQFFNVWPKKWSVTDFNAQENSVVIETLDLCYNYFTINK